MDYLIKLYEILENPRVNATATVYPIGSVVDDMRVIDYIYRPRSGVIPVCECIRCGRMKDILKCCLDNHVGTSHMACGQFEKMKDPKFHRTWQHMKSRIYNPNYVYFDRYGGRQLTCDYDAFADFYDDMYASYCDHVAKFGANNTSIDRINNDLGYIRGNLRWATQKEQVNNSSNMGQPFWAISPTGQYEYVTNKTDFCVAHNFPNYLSHSGILRRLRGIVKSDWNGWTFTYSDPNQKV